MSEKKIEELIIRHENVAFPLLYVLVIILVFAPVVFFGKTLAATEYYPDGITGENITENRPMVRSFNIDLATPAYYEAPMNEAVGQIYLDGEIPLWDPYQAAGMPLAAQYSTRAMFPFQIIEDIAPAALTDFFMLARLWIAGFFTFLFLRALSLSRRGAFLGGIFFMFSGTMVWFINLEQMVNIAMLVPMLLYSFEKAISTGRIGYHLLAVISVALVMLGGNPEVAAYVLLLAGVYAVVRIWMVSRINGERFTSLGKLILASVLGLGISAPLIVPFLEFAGYGHTVHPAGGPLGMGAVQVPYWVTGVFNPTFFELPTWDRWPPINGVWDFLGGYSGVLPLMIAVIGLIKGKGHKKLLVFFGIFGLIILLKNFGVLPFRWLGKLPLLDQIWSPRWAGPVWTFSFAVAGALGFDSLLAASKEKNDTGKEQKITTLAISYRREVFNRVVGLLLLLSAIAVNRVTIQSTLETSPYIGSISSLLMLTIFQVAAFFAGGFILLSKMPVTLTPKPEVVRQYSFWWIAIALIFSVMVIATNFPELLTDTHPLTTKPSWPENITNIAASVWVGGVVSILLVLAVLFITHLKNKPRALSLLIPLAIMEAWFLVPRGYDTSTLFLKTLPLVLGGVAIAGVIYQKKTIAVSLAILAIFTPMVLDITAPKGMPARVDPFEAPPFVEFLQQRQETDDKRIVATDGILMPNFSSALELYDVRYMNTVISNHYQAFTRYMSGVEWRRTDASSVVFSGRPEFVPEIPPQYGYSIAEVPIRESFQQYNRFYSLLGVKYLVTPPNQQFIYADGFGDWVNIDMPNYTSGIIRSNDNYFQQEAYSAGTWRREGDHLGVYSATNQSLIYKFSFNQPIKSGFLHSWLRLSEGGSHAEIYISADGNSWGAPLVNASGINPQYVTKTILPESVRGKSTLFIKFDGSTPSTNDGVSLEQWGIELEFSGPNTPLKYMIHGSTPLEIQPFSQFPLVYSGEVNIYENDQALPHAYISHDVRKVSSAEEAWDEINDPNINISSVVFCEEYVPGLDLDRTIPSSPNDKVTIDKYKTNRVKMTAQVEQPAMVVLNDSYSPGWRATVNGKPAVIYPINGLVRGVLVEPGMSKIEFEYIPNGFTLGIIIAVISAILCGVWMGVTLYKKRNKIAVKTAN